MATYTQLMYHIVFSTKNRTPTLTKDNRKQLFEYSWGILKNKKCHLYRMNGVEDHVHILTHIHPTNSLSDLLKDIKVSTSLWIKENKIFANFEGWQEGYGAFSCSYKEKDGLIEYIKNQEAHHQKISFEDEYRALLAEHGIEFEEKYLF
jgi:REP element-mobilizing transposase RayT